jgi:hypothetical protein
MRDHHVSPPAATEPARFEVIAHDMKVECRSSCGRCVAFEIPPPKLLCRRSCGLQDGLP